VLLFSRVPIRQVRSISLDPESLTSNALIRILCRWRFGIEPRWAARGKMSDPMRILESGKSDAVLVIGNRALAMSGRFPYEYDLGREWWRLTGLPFVFAVWAVRPGIETGDLPSVLRRSLRLGLAHLEQIADEAARTLDLDPVLCFNYLRKMIRYRMTERVWKGMVRFFELCADMGICPSRPPADLAHWIRNLRDKSKTTDHRFVRRQGDG
jgi:chorismate dehydratase